MGTAKADSSRSVIIKNAAGAVVTGTSVDIGSSASFSAHISITSGQYVFQISGATFSGGSCSGTRTLTSGTSFTPTVPGTVSIYVGFAIGKDPLSISPAATVTFTATNPTLAPTTRPTSRPTVLPTRSPTYLPNAPTPQPTPRPSPVPTTVPTINTGIVSTYVIACTFTLQGAGISDVQSQGLNLIAVLADELGVASTDVAIVSISSAPVSMAMLLRRALAMGDSASVSVNIMGYTSSSVASAAAASLSSYLQTGSFVADFASASGLAITGVAVTKQPTVGDVAVGAFPYQCRLNSHLTLWWAAPTESGGVSQVSAMLAMDSGSNWFSGGVVVTGETSMVSSTSTNKVFLYGPSANKLGCYSMKSKSASGFELDATMRTGAGITTVQTLPSSASMSFTLSTDTGVATDVPLAVGAGLHNTYIWAHGGRWPATHDNGDSGFVNVYWKDGTCGPPLKTRKVSAAYIFVVLLLVAVCNSPYSPATKLLQPLHATRLPLPYLHDYSLSGLGMLAIFFAFCLAVLFTHSKSAVVSLASLTSASGQVAILCFWLALIPTSKTSVTLWLFGVPFERAVKYHKVVTMTALCFSLLHLFANLRTNRDVFYSTAPFGKNNIKPLYGLLGFLAFASMSLMAVPWIRHHHHELFKLFHYLYWVGVALIVVHTSGGLLGLGFAPGIILHVVDKTRRMYLLLFWPQQPVAVAKVAEHTLTVTQITLPRTAKYVHGQYYYLHVTPDAFRGQAGPLSLIEWHPISVSGVDAHGPGTATFSVKSNGPDTWSGRLSYATIADGFVLDGPFGNLSVDLGDLCMRSVALVCGGIGLTPFLAILQDIVANNPGAYTHIERLHFVWSVREVELLEAFRPRLEALVAAARAAEAKGRGKGPCLVVDVYQTGGGGRSGSSSGGKDYTIVGSTRGLELGTWQPAQGSAPASAIDYHQGRPSLEALVEDLKADELSRRVNDSRARNCVLVCGPSAMSAGVQRAAASQRLTSHMEVFRL